MMEIMLNFLLGVLALLIIIFIVKSVLKKNTKDFNIKVGFFKGFEFNCSFFEDRHIEHHQ